MRIGESSFSHGSAAEMVRDMPAALRNAAVTCPPDQHFTMTLNPKAALMLATQLECAADLAAAHAKRRDAAHEVWTAVDLARAEVLALAARGIFRLKCTAICAAICFVCLIATWGLLQS